MATTAADPVFVDANVLVYSTVPSSPFHSPAVAALTDLRAAGTALRASRQVLPAHLSRFLPAELWSTVRP